MNIKHLNERVNDYKTSIDTVVQKKILWKKNTKELVVSTLKNITGQYDIGWRVQELNWINTREAVNIIFDSFPPDLIENTNQIPSYQFLQGAALIFSQSYSGDIYIFILFPIVENTPLEKNSIDLGVYDPNDISEKLIIEMVDEFLKEITKWELPNQQSKMGF